MVEQTSKCIGIQFVSVTIIIMQYTVQALYQQGTHSTEKLNQ